jgi:hypothetical protein
MKRKVGMKILIDLSWKSFILEYYGMPYYKGDTKSFDEGFSVLKIPWETHLSLHEYLEQKSLLFIYCRRFPAPTGNFRLWRRKYRTVHQRFPVTQLEVFSTRHQKFPAHAMEIYGGLPEISYWSFSWHYIYRLTRLICVCCLHLTNLSQKLSLAFIPFTFSSLLSIPSEIWMWSLWELKWESACESRSQALSTWDLRQINLLCLLILESWFLDG